MYPLSSRIFVTARFIFDAGTSTRRCPACWAFRILVRKSEIGSVMIVFNLSNDYQLAFLMPGILPSKASSRNLIRDTPYLPTYPRARPVSVQRFLRRVGLAFLGS